MKKQGLLLLVLTLIFFIGFITVKPCQAGVDIQVKVDGERLSMKDTKPILENDRILVPMRIIFEKLNAKVYWDQDSQTVTAQLGDNNIKLTINKKEALKNGQEILLDTSPRLINGTTMVPLRFVAEALGSQANWIAETNTAEIHRPGVEKLRLDWTWQFEGDLDFNFLMDEVGNVLIVFADDGFLSGYNEHTALLGIDKTTGEKIWQVDAKGWPMMSTDFVVSLDREYIGVLIKSEAKLIWLKTATGEIVWEKRIEEGNGSLSEICGSEGVVAYTIRTRDKSTLLYVCDEKTGETLWTKQLPSTDLLGNNFSYPVIILVGEQNITALDPGTGETRWEITGEIGYQNRSFYSMPYTGFKKDFRYFSQKEETGWFITKDKLIKVDLTSGEIITQVGINEKNFISILNDRYLLIKEYNLGRYGYDVFGKNVKDEDFTTSLYDLKEEKTLWQIEGRGSLAVIEGDVIYLLMEGYYGYPAALEFSTGKKLWQSPYQIGDMKNLVVWEDYILVSGKESLFFLDKETGEIVYWLADTQIREAEAKGPLITYGLVTKIGDCLYIGSSDGSFQALDYEQMGWDR